MLNTLIVIKQCLLRLVITNCLKTYTKVWGKISSLMNIKFDSESVYGHNDKYIKTKIKLYGDKINTNFQGKKYQKKMHHIMHHKCLSLVM